MTSTPSKKKGTQGELEVLRLLQPHIPGLVRNPASALVDLSAPGKGLPVQVLATRPDRGRWLFSMDYEDLAMIWDDNVELAGMERAIDIEVKRYTRFATHQLFEQKFRGRP